MLTEFLVGLVGALIGGGFVFAADVWRQVLEGRSAARILRLELLSNAHKFSEAVRPNFWGLKLEDEAWRELRVRLAPLMPGAIFDEIASNYSSLFVAQQNFDALEKGEKWALAHVRLLEESSEQQRRDARWLEMVATKNRAVQFFELLAGRPSLPAPTHPDFFIPPHRHYDNEYPDEEDLPQEITRKKRILLEKQESDRINGW